MVRNKARKMSYEQLSHFYKWNRRIFLILVFALAILGFYLLLKKFWLVAYLLIFMAGILDVYYVIYLRNLSKGIIMILTDELEVKRYLLANGLLKPDTLALPTLKYAYGYLVAGDWDMAEKYLKRIKPNRLKRSVSKNPIILYWFIDSFLNILQKKDVDLEQLSSQFTSLKIKNKKSVANRLAFLQAMADIEAGKANAYFETAEARYRLERLIFDYYQGRNALLEGKETEAREQFEKVAQTNKDDIYFVREAKNYLEEM